MAAGFVEALKRHSAELQQLESGQADEFLRLLEALRETLTARITRTGKDTALDAFRLREIIGETQAGILTLQKKAIGQYDAAAESSVDLAIVHIGDELDRLSVAFDARPLDISIDAAKALADPGQLLLANHFETSVARYGGELLNAVRQRLFIALRTGDPVNNVVRDIASERGPLGIVGRANGERLVRTETSSAYGAAQHSGLVQAAKQVPALKKVWLHVSSYRCETCMLLHGTTRPLDGTWTIVQGNKTRKIAHAPAHPNCGCRVSAMKPSWRAGLQKLGYLDQDPSDTKSSPARL